MLPSCDEDSLEIFSIKFFEPSRCVASVDTVPMISLFILWVTHFIKARVIIN